MAKQKNNGKSDYMSEKMDEQLGQLEDKITVLYANASYEVNQEWAKFSDTFKAKDATMLEKLENGEITQAEYTLWRNKNILQTDMYKSTVSSMTDILTRADVSAMAMVNDEMPAVVAESYDFVQALGWKSADEAGLSVGTFQIYNAESVQKIVRDNPDLLKSVDIPEDKKWNKDHINREITTGIIKGESLPKVADRLARVTDMDKNSATRNARTAMTYAENLGRSESAEKLKDMGIPEEEVWSATYDNRTRDSHLLLDGTKRDEKTGKFGEGILATPLRCPADPEGDASEIYNCRCRLNIVLQGIDHSKDDDLYEQFMKENYPDDWAKLQASESEQAKRETAEQTKEYQSVLKEIQKEGYYEPNKASEASETATSEITSKDAQEATQGKSEASEGTEDKNVTQTAEDILGNAYENHRIDNGLRSTPLDEMKDSPLSAVSASYEHLSDETAEKINGALTKLTNDYDTPLCRIRTMDSSEALGNKAYATTIHNYSTDTAEIILNPMKMGDYDAMTERVMELADKGYIPNIPQENAGEYIITHEFGHSILNMRDTLSNSQNWVDADFDKIRSARNEISEIYEEYTSVVGQLESEKKSLEFEVIMGTAGDDTAEKARELGKELAETRISNYSLTNIDEFLAESFANERLGLNSNPYAERAVEVLDKYFRR